MSNTESSFQLHRFASPIGTILLVTDADGVLRALDFADYEARMHRLLRKHYGTISLTESRAAPQLRACLQRYFDGDLVAINEVECSTNGTLFQRRIWRALRTIDAGRTQTYGQLAKQLGLTNAARAVGLANGANPIAIVVPCHRLIGADGELTGYAGGLERKRWLLEHEARIRG